MTTMDRDAMHGRRLASLLCLLAIIGSLALSIFVCEATRPPGQFLKYLDATARPRLAEDRRLDYSPLYLSTVRLLARKEGTLRERARPVLLLQCGLLACACGAITLLLCRTWGVVAGLTGLLLMATYRPLIVYAGVLEPESLIVSLLALFLLCGAFVKGRAQRWWSTTAGSVMVGLCVLLRPTFLLLIPCWAVWAAAADRSRRLQRGIFALAVSLIVIAPTVVGNYLESGSSIFMNPGPVFYEGNGPFATGLIAADPELVGRLETLQPPGDADYQHVAFRRIASAALGRTASAGESNRFWTRLAMETMRSFPAAAILRDCRKLAFAMSPYEAHDLINAQDFDGRLRRILPWGFSVILVGLPFSALLRRRDRAELLPAAAVAILVVAVQVVFYASARQRLPLALPGIMAVAAGIAELARRGRSRARMSLALLAAGLGLFALLGWLTAPAQWDLETGETEVLTAFGPPAKSDRSVLSDALNGRALRPESREAATLAARGRALYLAGRFTDALKTMEPVTSGVLAGSPTSRKDAAFWSSRTSLALGDTPRAKQLSRQAIASLPADLRSQALWLALNWNDRTLRDVEAWRPPGVDSVSARIALARELSFTGHHEAAVRLGASVVSGFPELAGKFWP